MIKTMNAIKAWLVYKSNLSKLIISDVLYAILHSKELYLFGNSVIDYYSMHECVYVSVCIYFYRANMPHH